MVKIGPAMLGRSSGASLRVRNLLGQPDVEVEPQRAANSSWKYRPRVRRSGSTRRNSSLS